jgi:hypothetical protein
MPDVEIYEGGEIPVARRAERLAAQDRQKYRERLERADENFGSTLPGKIEEQVKKSASWGQRLSSIEVCPDCRVGVR